MNIPPPPPPQLSALATPLCIVEIYAAFSAGIGDQLLLVDELKHETSNFRGHHISIQTFFPVESRSSFV